MQKTVMRINSRRYGKQKIQPTFFCLCRIRKLIQSGHFDIWLRRSIRQAAKLMAKDAQFFWVSRARKRMKRKTNDIYIDFQHLKELVIGLVLVLIFSACNLLFEFCFPKYI